MQHSDLRPATAFAFILFCSPLAAQNTTRVSVDSAGMQASSYSQTPSISADGRYVAFSSHASHLVSGDTNGVDDIFVHDRVSGLTERVSVDSNGAQSNGISSFPTISVDGRYVAFESLASNLVAGDTNGHRDVFVHDRMSGVTSRVSVDSNGVEGGDDSGSAVISADGRFVAFVSLAGNLVPNDTNDKWDIFLRDTQSNTTERVSVDSSGAQAIQDSGSPSISSGGRYIAFESAADNLVAGDTNHSSDVFVHQRLTGATVRVSVDSSGNEGNHESHSPSISADGRFVAFDGWASDFAPFDNNNGSDVFVHDSQSGQTICVSLNWNGSGFAVGGYFPSISADGRFVAFHSGTSALVPNDTNVAVDVFVNDRLSGTTTRVSIESVGAEANNGSYFPSISADGRSIAFQSAATNLVFGDTNGEDDIFVRDGGTPMVFSSCFGQGVPVACPCGNSGLAGRGCDNSAGTGGAILTSGGVSSLQSDSFVLATAFELNSALSIFLQGNQFITPTHFGDGLRCAGGILLRLYVKSAMSGGAAAPVGADPTISARSFALGDLIPLGATRTYQVYYRDPSPTFCPSPLGNTWNVTNSLSAVWGP